MGTSSLQEETKARLRLVLSTCTIHENFRPDWLPSPDTGRPMELDFWLPEANVAVEVQGQQHYEFVPFFHGTEAKFHAQQKRDAAKRQICQERGIHLFEIAGIGEIDDFIDGLKAYDQEVFKKLFDRNLAIKRVCHLAGEIWRESQRKRPDQKRLAALSNKLILTAGEYNIPLKSIKSDITIGKMSLSFPTKPAVKVKLVEYDEIRGTEKAVVMNVEDNIATLRWLSRGYTPGHYTDVKFDLTTGQSADGNEERHYKIRPGWYRPPLLGEHIEVHQKFINSPFYKEFLE